MNKGKGASLNFLHADSIYCWRLRMDGDINMQGSQITDLSAGENPYDAVTVKQLEKATTLESPDGSEWKISVADDGTLSATKV